MKLYLIKHELNMNLDIRFKRRFRGYVENTHLTQFITNLQLNILSSGSPWIKIFSKRMIKPPFRGRYIENIK